MKYLKLFWAFAKTSFIADMEYRVNFISRILTDVIWYVAQILTFETLFRYTEKIGGWNLPEMRVFLGVLFVVDGFYMVLFQENLDTMTEKIRKGDMDLLLVKPVSSQFMMSLRKTSTAMIGNLIIGTSWFIYSVTSLENFQTNRLLWLIFLMPVALIINYSLRMLVATVSIIVTRADYLQFAWYQISRLALRPDKMYTAWLRYVVLTVLPLAAMASVPARALLDPPEYFLFLWVGCVAVFFLWLSTRFWNYALKHYTSASS